MFRSSCVAIILILIAAPSIAGPPIAPVESLDVAGVRLGMTPGEARVALEAKGYSLSDDSMYLSWKAQVAQEAGKYANVPKDTTRATWQTEAEGPDYQKVEVRYEISAAGSHVKKVTYSRPADRGDLLADAKHRYGEPTKASSTSYFYCPQWKGCPAHFLGTAPFPTLEIHSSYSGRSEIILFQGTVADDALKSSFEKAVREIAPNYGKANF